MVNKELHEKILKVCVILLVFLIISNTVIHLYYWDRDWTEIFWYCNIAALVLAFGILLKKSAMVSVVLVTAIPAQFFWIADFFIKLFGFEGLGRTTQLFELPFSIAFISSVLHLLLIPIAIYATILYGFKKKSFLFGIILILFLIFVPYFFTSFGDNINCVFYPCDLTYMDLEGRPITFPEFGSLEYAGFILIRWLSWFIVSYYSLLLLFQRVFKRVQIV